MVPLIIPAVTSVANTILDNWNQVTQTPPAVQQQPRVEFDSLLKMRSLSGAPGVQPTQFSDVTGALMKQLLEAPEVASALGGQNLPPGSKLEFGADGGLSLRSADGFMQPLNLSPETRILAANVHASMTGGQS